MNDVESTMSGHIWNKKNEEHFFLSVDGTSSASTPPPLMLEKIGQIL
jgi:hypothetical protein